MGNKEVKRRVRKLVVEKKIESDHHPIEITMKRKERRRRAGKRRERRSIWDEEGRKCLGRNWKR